MAASLNLSYVLLCLLVCQTLVVSYPSSNNPDPLCSAAQLIAPGQGSWVYKYTTEVKLAVANAQYDLETKISADVNIKSAGDCDYLVQLRNVKIVESQDDNDTPVNSPAQRELENVVVRFRWVDGYVILVESDQSAKVDHVNFIKGILSTLHIQGPVPADGEDIVREEDVLGVCTTRYKFSQRGSVLQINKNKDLSTCSRDKLHLSSSPVLTSLLGPMIEEVFSAKSRYVCQTEVSDKKIQSVKCKTIEIESDDDRKPGQRATNTNQRRTSATNHVHNDDSDSDEDTPVNFNDRDDDEISSKLIFIKQELKLQASGSGNVDGNAVRNGVRQTLQFIPTPTFAKSEKTTAALVSKIQSLLKSKDWDQFAAARFVEIANELRLMDKTQLNAFKSESGLKHVVSTFLDTVYSHTPVTASINLDSNTLKFANPLAVLYLDKPSKELVEQVVQAARRLNANQVPEFVGLAAAILKSYKARQDNVKDADSKIQDFQRSISRFLNSAQGTSSNVTTTVLAAYAQLGLYDDQVRRLAANDQASLDIQYHALNAIRHICEDYINDANQLSTRTGLQNLLLRKLQNKSNKNAVRIWAFEALYTPFIYNPETDDSPLADDLEKALGNILNEPLNQVNGYIWSALKYSSLDRLCPLRGLAARLRVHHQNKKQFKEQETLSSRKIELEIPLRKNYRAVIQAGLIFENDRVVPSFIGVKLAFDGIRRETLRLPWIDLALISENLDYNFAEYFLNLDPLNKKTNINDNEKNQLKRSLPPGVQQIQKTHDDKEEDPDPNVYLYLKLFGTDLHSVDVTNKVQDILKTNLRTYLRNRLLNQLKDLSDKYPIFRIPLEIGAATAAANGLTLYKSAQLGILADLTTDVKDTRDQAGLGKFSLTSQSALSLSLTFQREIASPLTNIGETVHLGILSSVPFEYRTEANEQGRIREFNLLNPQATLLATDFQYALRTSKGLNPVANAKTSNIDPSCTPSLIYRGLGIRACLEMNPFRSLQLGNRPSYPITVTVSKDPSIKKWRIGWRFNAQDAPQYEVAVEKVGATATYPGLGISATKTGNNFDIKVLTGMKSFNVKGAQNGNRFTGSIYSSDNKEVMTTSGTLNVNADGFKLDAKLVDSASKREVATLTTDINPNRGQGLTADIGLATPDKAKSFKINFRGDIYKPNSQLIHIGGNFNLGETTYTGKAHLERNEDKTRIELHRSMKLARSSSLNGYEFLYERKNNRGPRENSTSVAAHLTVQTPGRDDASKVFDLKSDFTRSNDLANATLRSSLDFLILTRNPPVSERIELDYSRRSIRTTNQAQRLVSPAANLKIQVKTKSNVFNFLVDHRHRRSSEASRKGSETLPPTLEIENKIHIVADTDRLLPDLPRPFAFDVSSDLEFELLNKLNYKIQYDLRQRQRSGSFSYKNQVTRVTDGHLFAGTSDLELVWDNKQKRAKGTGDFVVCTKMRSVKSHLDIDTNIVPDRNDVTLDVSIRFDRLPKPNAPKSLIVQYDVTIQAPKHEFIQLIDLDGNITRREGILEAFNSIAYRREKALQEINIDLILDRNQTGDGSFHTHIDLSLPFKNLPYITHDLLLKRETPTGRLNYAASQLIAKPVLAHYARVNIDRSKANQPPYVHVDNELEYLRGNGDSLYAMSKIDVNRWSVLHSTGLLRRNTDLLHRHSIGYIFSDKTRRVALSLESPQLSGNPLSIIGEVTMDREHRIGKMKWPQEFGVHLEFGTPLTNVTALQVYYNLPMFHEDDDQTVDATVAFKLASSKITPIDFHLQSQGSLNTTLHVTKSLNVGDDIALSALLTAQYHPDTISQMSVSTSSKYYTQEFQNALYILFKDHQMTVRGIINTTDNEDYKYEMDIGFDDLLLTGHTERTDGRQTTVSDIEARKCQTGGKFNRCYRGDITIRSGNSGSGQRGSFDVSWGRGTAKLDVKVPSQIEIKFDHTHSGRLRDEDFSSKTNIDGKFLQNNNRAGFTYSGSVDKEDGRWNKVQIQGSATDRQSGQKSFATDINLNQRISNKLTGQFQRDIKVNLEHKGQPMINWASNSASCTDNPSNVVQGICQNTNFNIKTSNQFAQRLRQRLQLPVDPKLSNPNGQVTYDGTLKLDLKSDPKSGPHTAKLDLNRMKEDTVDVDVSFQPRSESTPMKLQLKANLPDQSPISVKYDETRRSPTSFQGTLKYSFNANDNSAEKTYQCEVDGRALEDLNIDCKGERTTLKLDIDRRAGKSIAYITLNRFDNEKIGYEAVRNPQTNELDATIYTFVTSWNIKRQPGRSLTLRAQQKGQDVLRIEGTKVNNQEFQVKFSPANVNLQLTWDNSTLITLKQTAPQSRNLITITVDRARIRPYLPSLRNQDRPSQDIDETTRRSGKPLVEIALDSHTLLSLSEPLHKIGSHNGRYGLDTIKKAFKLIIGGTPVTVYNTQHWKTHRENSEIPESYVIRLVNDANGNIVQVATNKWNEYRLISEIGHSFDGGRTMTTDFKLDRNYAHQVGMMYFFNSLGYRNVQGVRALRNRTSGFVRENLRKNFEKTNVAALSKDFRARLRTILEKDYAAVKTIVSSWNQESEKSFLRRFSNRLGLPDFFAKYPTYNQASDRIFTILAERSVERENFWRERFQNIINDNRLKDLAERVQARRNELIKRLLDRAEPLLERFLPKVDQANIDKRIADYVVKLVNGFEQVLKRNTEQWKNVFKAIDDASKGEDTKWFRTLVADINSNEFSAQADAEVTRVIKKLGDSSKLLISNIQQISRGMTKRQENIRERVKNAIRHIPNAYINDTNFELLVPVGRQPGSYVGTSELLLGIGSLLRNRDQAFDTIRSILINRLDAGAETRENYFKAVRSLAKRLFRRNPSLTPEYKAVIAQTGDAIDLHGEYIYLNPQCDYLLAHDFADLQFSFRFSNGRVFSLLPNQVEIREHECSNTGRVQICNEGNFYRLNVPMHYGGRVDGALGDVRDHSSQGRANLNRWALQGCGTRDQPRRGGSSIVECASDDDDEQDFCENYVQNGLRKGQDRRRLLTDVMEIRRQI